MIDLYPKESFKEIDNILDEDIVKKYCYHDKNNYENVGNQKYNSCIHFNIFTIQENIRYIYLKFQCFFSIRKNQGINFSI